MASAPYIVVAGGIASGKTTLALRLAERLQTQVFLERPERNPFVMDFYGDPERWSLASQLWFTADTLRYQAAASSGGIQDHSSYEAVHVFGAALRDIGHLQPREYDLLESVLTVGLRSLRTPDVVLLLRAPVEQLRKRIWLRGRAYEQDITAAYLQALVDQRERYFDRWTLSPVIPIATEQIDSRRDADLEHIVRRIKQTLSPSLV